MQIYTHPFDCTSYDSHLHHLHSMKVQNFAAQHVRQPSVLQHQAGLHYKTIQEIEVGKHFFLNGRKKLGEGRKNSYNARTWVFHIIPCRIGAINLHNIRHWNFRRPCSSFIFCHQEWWRNGNQRIWSECGRWCQQWNWMISKQVLFQTRLHVCKEK